MATSKITVNVSLRFGVLMSYILIKLHAPNRWIFKVEV